MKNWNINKEKKLSAVKYLALIVLIVVWLSMIVFTYPVFTSTELIRYFLLISFFTLNCCGLAYFILMLGRITEQEKVLKGQYQEYYMVVKNKINTSLLNAKNKRTSFFDLMSIFLEAQKSNKNIADLIPDPDEFAQEIIDAYGIRPYGIKEVIDGLLWSLLFLFFVYFVPWVLMFFFPTHTLGNRNFFQQTISVSTILFAALCFGNPIEKNYAHKNVRLDIQKIGLIIHLSFGSAIFGLQTLNNLYGIGFNIILHQIQLIPNFQVLIFYALMISFLLLSRGLLIRRRTLRFPNRDERKIDYTRTNRIIAAVLNVLIIITAFSVIFTFATLSKRYLHSLM